MKVQVLFTIDQVPLNAARRQILADHGVEWRIVLIKNTRYLIDMCLDSSMVQPLKTVLTPYNPKLIGAWSVDGEQLQASDNVEYALFFADLGIRHQFAGWSVKQL